MQHLLVTNDFPPKIGGIQSYLYELWRRQDPETFAVLTSKSHPDVKKFDAEQDFSITRCARWLIPSQRMQLRIQSAIENFQPEFVVLDPAVPLGILGPRLKIPYVVVLHGAEVTIPARVPLLKSQLKHVLCNASAVISAGDYAAQEARRLVKSEMPPVAIIPPGVDVERFHTVDEIKRKEIRSRYQIKDDAVVVIGHSRLVPRKGFDSLIRAVASCANSNVECLIVGQGRDRKRLEKLAQELNAPVRFLGRVSDEQLVELLAASDISAMLCRSRWMGLEQEGFGIVFVEAAAAGLPQLGGRSGGAAEAVADNETGFVVDPRDQIEVIKRLQQLIDDKELRTRLGAAARKRAETAFSYDHLAGDLTTFLADIASRVH